MNIQTPRLLQSYLCGEWQNGSRDGKELLNAATGEVVALIDASGLDHAAALEYGREKGGKALRAMTVHQRALMLKEIGLKLLEMQEDEAAETKTGVDYEVDKTMWKQLYKKYIQENENLDDILEWDSLYWNGDKVIVDTFVLSYVAILDRVFKEQAPRSS